MDKYQYIMFIASVMLSIQLLPQNYKIYKNKSAKEISYISIMITLLGVFGIILYGVHNELIEIWAPAIIQIIFALHLGLMKIYYDNFYHNFYQDNNMIIYEPKDDVFTSHISIGITKGNFMDNEFKFRE
jgi:uncharacterized protein with PQ loop repeat